MASQDRVVRQSPQISGFEDTSEKLNWYGSNSEGIDRERTPDAMYFDEFFALDQEEHDSDPNNGEWSQPTYSDASRQSLSILKSSLPFSLPSSISQT